MHTSSSKWDNYPTSQVTPQKSSTPRIPKFALFVSAKLQKIKIAPAAHTKKHSSLFFHLDGSDTLSGSLLIKKSKVICC